MALPKKFFFFLRWNIAYWSCRTLFNTYKWITNLLVKVLWLRSSVPKVVQARIHTGFHRFTEIGHIFHNKYIFDNKNTFKVGIWPVSCLNDYEIQERGL